MKRTHWQPTYGMNLVSTPTPRLVRFKPRLPPPRRLLWDAKMRCPIGRKIPSKNPKAIGIAVAAELLEKWAYRAQMKAAPVHA